MSIDVTTNLSTKSHKHTSAFPLEVTTSPIPLPRSNQMMYGPSRSELDVSYPISMTQVTSHPRRGSNQTNPTQPLLALSSSFTRVHRPSTLPPSDNSTPQPTLWKLCSSCSVTNGDEGQVAHPLATMTCPRIAKVELLISGHSDLFRDDSKLANKILSP